VTAELDAAAFKAYAELKTNYFEYNNKTMFCFLVFI
jgi:hypothetical protein